VTRLVAAMLAGLWLLLVAPAAFAQADDPSVTAANPPAVEASEPAAQDQEDASTILSLDEPETASAIRIAIILTVLSVLPALIVSTTSFVRIVVVLSMIRHAFGMPETPPTAALVSLALFLTMFTMAPTAEAIYERSLQPFMTGELAIEGAAGAAAGPVREFMLRQVRDRDLRAIYEISDKPLPERAEDVGLMQLIPAFMLNELRVAFQIGFVVLLPFLLIDLVVSSILLSLGMIMVPPTVLSLPVKVLMFVLIDGWALVLEGVAGSFR